MIFLRPNAIRLGVITGVYVAAFFLTFAVWQPFQNRFIADLGIASLLFLPHGVRVIAAALYGWRAVFFLLPGALLTHLAITGVTGMSIPIIWAMFAGIIAAPLVFEIANRLGLPALITRDKASWSLTMALGLLAGLVNSALANLAFGHAVSSYVAYVFGDFFGQAVCFVVLLSLWRLRRRAEDTR